MQNRVVRGGGIGTCRGAGELQNTMRPVLKRLLERRHGAQRRGTEISVEKNHNL